MTKKPKIAIYYDWLNQWGGAERVLLNLLKLYPQADIFTLDYQPHQVPWLPSGHRVISLNLKNKIYFSPLYTFRLEKLDLSAYDILISTTAHVGHSFLTPPKTLFLCYFHNLNRYLYLRPPGLLKPLLKKYRQIDYILSRRPDNFLCNSQTVQKRLWQFYRRKATIIHPGVDLHFFRPSALAPQKYFLIVSRLVRHKNIETAIKAFKKLPHKLIIVGTGRDQSYLKKLAASCQNIRFLGKVSDKTLLSLYQNCQALIHPQEEDFGLTALEAQACGRGVIAFKKGGATETVIPGKTGQLYSQNTSASLSSAINIYLQRSPSSKNCRQNALRFSDTRFMLNFKKQVNHLWQLHQKKTIL